MYRLYKIINSYGKFFVVILTLLGAILPTALVALGLDDIPNPVEKDWPAIAYYTFFTGGGVGYTIAVRTVLASEKEKSAERLVKANMYDELMRKGYENYQQHAKS